MSFPDKIFPDMVNGEKVRRNCMIAKEIQVNADDCKTEKEKMEKQAELDFTIEFLRKFHHPSYNHLVNVEWKFHSDLTGPGQGDLIFARQKSADIVFSNLMPDEPTVYSDPESFEILLVEVKYLNPDAKKPTKRRNRQKLRDQVVRAMDYWKERRPQDTVFGMFVINEDNAENPLSRCSYFPEAFESPIFSFDTLDADTGAA